MRPLVVSDMDGTLTTAETWKAVLAWVRDRHPSPAARRFVWVHLPLVARLRLGLMDREAFRGRWLGEEAALLRDLPEARLVKMGEWVVEAWLWPARRTAAIKAVSTALEGLRADGSHPELYVATAAYQPVADAFAARMGATGGLGTPLEVREGRSTGRLAGPVSAGIRKASLVSERAAGRQVAVAFGDSEADLHLLALAERPVAVDPDAALRRTAARSGWEILEDPG